MRRPNKNYTEKTKKDLEDAQQQTIENTKSRLVNILGEAPGLITSIKLDTQIGKFFDIEVPSHALEKLRAFRSCAGNVRTHWRLACATLELIGRH
jgi:hypothetical protein